MKLGYTILYVQDVNKTVTFYEKAFGLTRGFMDDTHGYAEMETGATKLAFISYEMAETNGVDFGQLGRVTVPPAFEIAFVTDDVAGAFNQAIASGASELKKPTQKPWGQIVSYVKDCNGMLVEICSPMS